MRRSAHASWARPPRSRAAQLTDPASRCGTSRTWCSARRRHDRDACREPGLPHHVGSVRRSGDEPSDDADGACARSSRSLAHHGGHAGTRTAGGSLPRSRLRRGRAAVSGSAGRLSARARRPRPPAVPGRGPVRMAGARSGHRTARLLSSRCEACLRRPNATVVHSNGLKAHVAAALVKPRRDTSGVAPARLRRQPRALRCAAATAGAARRRDRRQLRQRAA